MMLPTVEELAGARNNRQRADWLNECPPWVIAHHCMDIRLIFQAADFTAGIASLDAEIALLHARRDRLGAFREGPNFAAHLARIDMAMAARRERT
ncbi:MAG: hypothetical protein JWM58_555 [Rhizobium sp.]|nr:hypothetical protein [Rhizobium sp.]